MSQTGVSLSLAVTPFKRTDQSVKKVCAFQKLSETAGSSLQLQGAKIQRAWCSEGPAAPAALCVSLQNLWELYSVSCRHTEPKCPIDSAALLP